MKLHIPRLGDDLTLASDWAFMLYDEYRNQTMTEQMGITFPPKPHFNRDENPPVLVTIPAGEKLKVDRIYIRKGAADFDSVTFLWTGRSTEPKIINRTMRRVNGPNDYQDIPYESKKPRKPVRFWAKLDDVNKIEFE